MAAHRKIKTKNGRAAKNLTKKWPRSEKFDPEIAAQRKI
jgi:hypothetical protein